MKDQILKAGTSGSPAAQEVPRTLAAFIAAHAAANGDKAPSLQEVWDAASRAAKNVRTLTSQEIMAAVAAYDHERHTYDCEPIIEKFCVANGLQLRCPACDGLGFDTEDHDGDEEGGRPACSSCDGAGVVNA